MANSAHRDNGDPERACCVRSYAARKRTALQYTRHGAGGTCRWRRRAGGLPPPAKADAILPALLARSAGEEEAERQRRPRDDEIGTVLYEQGVASALAFGDKKQERIFVDLTSDDDSG